MKKVAAIGIMVATDKQRIVTLKNYMGNPFVQEKLFIFTPAGIDWEKKRIQGVHFHHKKWKTGYFPFPKVVYNRCYGSDWEIVHRLEQVIGKNKCFNQINQFDKLEVHRAINRWLSNHVPEAVPYGKEALEEMLHRHKLVFLKPRRGSMGKGVFRIEQLSSGEVHISNHHVMPSIIAGSSCQLHDEAQRIVGAVPYMIQQGIYSNEFNHRFFDIRVLVQKNDRGLWATTNVISRVAHAGCFNTSICEKVMLTKNALNHLCSSDSVLTLMQTIYNMSMRTAEILELDAGIHLCEVSVDLVIDLDGHLWIIEVNGMPQKSLYKGLKTSRRAVYTRPLEYAAYLCKR